MGATATGGQSFGYDRYGNRTITSAWGTGINGKQFTVNATNNQLLVPSGQTGTMTYDVAGNLTTDTYSGAAVTRAYDAENRMTSETQSGSIVAGSYAYDADGHRVKRTVSGTTTWQVYGLGGELLAEYAANTAASSPQKEYGYRNGELLITAEPNTANNAVQWLVSDQLGTPRMIADKTGSLAGIKRHDYLPFGEELFAGTGGRTTAQGYTGDSVRQKFTSHERDNETNLDYMQARHFNNVSGRFISADTVAGLLATPQTLNLYAYVANNPLRYIDPTGHKLSDIGIFQTDDPREARIAEQQGLHDLQVSVNNSYQQRQRQEQPRIMLLVGQPGIQQNVGADFMRAAQTRQSELQRSGQNAFIVAVAGETDVASALVSNGMLDGVEYFGHSGPNALFIGDGYSDEVTLESSELGQLSNRNLTFNASITLHGCNTAVGDRDSFASMLSIQLERTTFGYDQDSMFSSNRDRPTGARVHPSRGPTYLVPRGGGGMRALRGFTGALWRQPR